MKIISVDPGETTGILVAEWDEVHSPVIRKLFSLPDIQVSSAVLGEAPDLVIIERPPMRASTPNLAFDELIHSLVSLSGQTRVVIYSPGDWKPICTAQSWTKRAKGDDQHQKDAYNLAKYWLYREHPKILLEAVNG